MWLQLYTQVVADPKDAKGLTAVRVADVTDVTGVRNVTSAVVVTDVV